MEARTYTRKTFTVQAVEVTLNNISEVAEWCGGGLVMVPTKMLGVETELPVIKIKGTGSNKGQDMTATLGCFVVELKGSFRVYKPIQFWNSFEAPKDASGCTPLFQVYDEDDHQTPTVTTENEPQRLL